MSTIGVHNISLRQVNLTGVSTDLKVRIESSKRLRAAIGYWTLAPDALSDQLTNRLSDNGFLCVDLHSPTQLRHLCDLSCGGANVYLHLEEAKPSPQNLSWMPKHLMHAKTLLFDIDDDLAELWVGSHNGTARAYGGVNIEASLIVTLERRAPLYSEVESFLNTVRSRCEFFDPNLMDWYNWLQKDRKENTEAALHLIVLDSSDLTDQKLTLFGDDESSLADFPKTGSRLLVVLIDAATSRQTLYMSQVLDQGLLPGANPNSGGLTFDIRHHAFHFSGTKPVVAPPSVPDPARVAASSYFVTLELHYRESAGTSTVDPINSPRFVEPDQDRPRRFADDWFYEVEGLAKDAGLIIVPNRAEGGQRRAHGEEIFRGERTSPIRRVVRKDDDF